MNKCLRHVSYFSVLPGKSSSVGGLYLCWLLRNRACSSDDHYEILILLCYFLCLCVFVCVCICIETKRKPWISFISLHSPCFLRSLSRLRGWSVSSRIPPASASQYWDYRHVFIYLGGLGNMSCRYRNCGTWFPSSTMCIPGIELRLPGLATSAFAHRAPLLAHA